MKHDQFTLPFLDTTIVAEGFGLYAGFPTAKSSAHAQINVEPEEAELLDAPVPTKPSLPAQDYRLVGDRRLAESWKGRAEDNLAAIRVMTAIEAEGRHARSDEQERLAKFTAFGAVDLAEKLFRRAGDAFAPAWEDLGVELEGLVSRDDLANLKRATQYAHYTPEFMIRAIWRALRQMRADDPAGELRLSLHDYFIARSVERLRPGGLAAFVTSRWTMDKVDGKARRHIAAMADLIGAVRLPEGAMHDRAGTEVVVDILFLQKRDGQGPMVGDYISTSFGSDAKAHPTFAVAIAPSGSVRDEAIYTTASGLTAADGTAAVNTFFIPQPIDAALGDLADQVAIALGVEPIG